MKQIILLLILTVLVTSCGQKQKDNVRFAAEVQAEMAPAVRQASDKVPPPPSSTPEIKQEVIKKKIIKDGRLGLRVSELEKTKVRIDTLVHAHSGYFANESFNNTDYESSYTLKIRIPCANFEKFIAAIERGESEILYKEIDARDVTDEFIDLGTRLENKRNYLKRYSELLKQAKSVKEILEIEEKIRVLEEEIESTTGRLKYLGDLVDYSTLDLTISKLKDFKYHPANRDMFRERLKQSLSKGWFGLVDFTLFVIRIWPFWIIVTVIFYFWKRIKKRKVKK
jgi:hypothetical protein